MSEPTGYIVPRADLELAGRIVELLNELAALDLEAVTALIGQRVPCNEALADHPTVQAGRLEDGGPLLVGILGVLNGLCGTHPSGWGPVGAIFAKQGAGELTGFAVIGPEGSRVVLPPRDLPFDVPERCPGETCGSTAVRVVRQPGGDVDLVCDDCGEEWPLVAGE